MQLAGVDDSSSQPGAALIPPRPTPPLDSDCCGNDCALCVFTLYERELERWQQAVAEQSAKADPS